MENETLLDKIGRLSAQRTVRTDRLAELTGALLAKLHDHTVNGDQATVDGARLSRVYVTSNVGGCAFWLLELGNASCYLDWGHAGGYLHGDFSAPMVGPDRAALLAFASRAARFVAELVARQQADVDALAVAADSVERAIVGL